MLQVEDKNIPRGLAPLEDLFDFDDVAKNTTIKHADSDVEEFNIGTEDEPKMIKLAKSLPANMKRKYILTCSRNSLMCLLGVMRT